MGWIGTKTGVPRGSKALATALVMTLMLPVLPGCASVGDLDSGNVAGIATSSVPQRVVTKIINNACGSDAEETAEESLSTGSVKGLSKVIDGFGVPYDERADSYTTHPTVVTDDSYEANKERGIGYTGIEDHYVAALASGQAHSPDHPEHEDVGTAMFTGLTTKEEQYGCAMRWEYYNPDLSGPAVDGYFNFLKGNGSGHMQYLAVHATKTDKWVIVCPYDWGPALNLPTTGGGKYAGGRIGGLSPAAAEALGISGGDGPENAMTEWWWVENSSQVECGPIDDLSSLTKGATPDGGTKKPATIHLAAEVSSSLIDSISRNSDANAKVSITPLEPSAFASGIRPEYALSPMDKADVTTILMHDITGIAGDPSKVVPCQRSHFVIDENGKVTQQVPMDMSARSTGDDSRDSKAISIALVHDRSNGSYRNAQLNALDRLVAYIDRELGRSVVIGNHDDGECGDEFPAEAYDESRNHSNVKTVADAQVALENGECTDDEGGAEDEANPDAGGPGIAKKAVEISGSASPKEAITGAWGEVPTASSLQKYVSEKNRVYPGVSGWADCGRCASTAVKASGADTQFPSGDTANQFDYMSGSRKWQRVGTLRTGDALDSLCKPGDVLVTEGKGHIMVYVGNDAVKEKYPDSTANMFEGSLGKYYGWCYHSQNHSGASDYAIFRCIKPDNAGVAGGSSSSRLVAAYLNFAYSRKEQPVWSDSRDIYERVCDRVIKGHPSAGWHYHDCAVTVWAGIKWAGCSDPSEYPSYTDMVTIDQYLRSSSDWTPVSTAQNIPLEDTDEWAKGIGLQPGDIGVAFNGSVGHTLVYLGEEGIQKGYEKYVKGTDGDLGAPDDNVIFIQSSARSFAPCMVNYRDSSKQYSWFRYTGDYPDASSNADLGELGGFSTKSSKRKSSGSPSAKPSSGSSSANQGEYDYSTKSKMEGIPNSTSWFESEKGYVEAMQEKADLYWGAKTQGITTWASNITMSTTNEWFVLIDCDYCRMTLFHNEGTKWKAVAGWSTLQGMRQIEFAGETNYSGCRSCTHKGIHRIFGRYAEINGMKWACCYVPDDHANEMWNFRHCQKVHHLCGRNDPTKMFHPTDETWDDQTDRTKSCFASHGCTCLKDDIAEWFFNTMPTNTEMVIFDRYNPTPGIGEFPEALKKAGQSNSCFDLWGGPADKADRLPMPTYGDGTGGDEDGKINVDVQRA